MPESFLLSYPTKEMKEKMKIRTVVVLEKFAICLVVMCMVLECL
jgi:hypothetical protein